MKTERESFASKLNYEKKKRLDIHKSSKSDNVSLKVAVRERIEKLKRQRTKIKKQKEPSTTEGKHNYVELCAS